jgi:hypothetical protein
MIRRSQANLKSADCLSDNADDDDDDDNDIVENELATDPWDFELPIDNNDKHNKRAKRTPTTRTFATFLDDLQEIKNKCKDDFKRDRKVISNISDVPAHFDCILKYYDILPKNLKATTRGKKIDVITAYAIEKSIDVETISAHWKL